VAYTLEFTRNFVRQFERLDRPVQQRIYRKLEEVKENPYRFKPLSGPLKGCFRIHVGPFRVIYLPQMDGRKVILLDVEAREKVYRKGPTV
jgi:mRNA-degrading endonuclease RelE of RelBE toxin-antitoxin system